jgi:hypothetical protein
MSAGEACLLMRRMIVLVLGTELVFVAGVCCAGMCCAGMCCAGMFCLAACMHLL